MYVLYTCKYIHMSLHACVCVNDCKCSYYICIICIFLWYNVCLQRYTQKCVLYMWVSTRTYVTYSTFVCHVKCASYVNMYSSLQESRHTHSGPSIEKWPTYVDFATRQNDVSHTHTHTHTRPSHLSAPHKSVNSSSGRIYIKFYISNFTYLFQSKFHSISIPLPQSQWSAASAQISWLQWQPHRRYGARTVTSANFIRT